MSAFVETDPLLKQDDTAQKTVPISVKKILVTRVFTTMALPVKEINALAKTEVLELANFVRSMAGISVRKILVIQVLPITEFTVWIPVL